MSKSKTIVTTTTAMSSIAGKIAKAIQSENIPSKQGILNIIAAEIAGDKHDWGYLTTANGAIVQKGIPESRLADLHSVRKPAPSTFGTLLQGDRSKPGIYIEPMLVTLFEEGHADILAEAYDASFLCLSNEFTCDTEDGTPSNTDDDRAMCLDADGNINAYPVFGGTPEDLRRFSLAHTTASSSFDVNHTVTEAIKEIEGDVYAAIFRSYAFRHALIVAPEYMFDPDWLDEDEAYEADTGAIRIYIDRKATPEQQEVARAQVEDFLIRMGKWLVKKDENAWMRNVIVLSAD